MPNFATSLYLMINFAASSFIRNRVQKNDKLNFRGYTWIYVDIAM